MKNLTLTLEQEISILDKYRLTPTALMFLKTLLILQDDGNEEPFRSYFELLHNCGVKICDVISYLQDKEIILKSYKAPQNDGDKFDPNVIPINKFFIKNMYKSSFELGKELFEEYPAFTIINNSYTSLRGVSKHFNSLEDCYIKYSKSIGWNPEIHREILELIRWGKEHELINSSLGSFVVNNGWHDLSAIKRGEAGNINFDTIREL